MTALLELKLAQAVAPLELDGTGNFLSSHEHDIEIWSKLVILPRNTRMMPKMTPRIFNIPMGSVNINRA